MFTHTFTTSATASGDEEKLPVAMNGHHPWLKPIVALLLMLLSAAVGLCQPAVQEKVYLHLDNNCYHAGDTIWYAAYTVRADDNRPTDMSRILYVELLNEQGYLVERQQLVVDYDGRSHGQFALPDTAWAGYYEVRAYTKWMMNFRHRERNPYKEDYQIRSDLLWASSMAAYEYELPYMFSRVVPVYQRNDSTHNYKRKMIPRKITSGNYELFYNLPKFNIKFYPEGGHIVQGLPCRVAFEISNEQTQRMDMTGVLLEDGEVIDSIRTSRGGRGVFTLLPMKGRTYKTRFVLDGKSFENRIEQIEPEGVTMAVDNGDETVDIALRQSGSLFDSDSLTLRVLCRGVELMDTRIVLSDGVGEAHFLKRHMREGVNELVLCDTDGEVIASRMVFVKTSEWPEKSKSYQQLKPYEKTRLTLDLGREFANTTVSLAVTDKGQRDQSYHDGNIMTELLLQSDVRGFVDNVAWYFESDDEQHRAALDLLMMVQGWSRYDWGKPYGELPYNAEKTTAIKCKLEDIPEVWWRRRYRNKAKEARVSLRPLESNEVFKGTFAADSLGRFTIAYKPFYGDAILQISAFYTDKLKHSKKYRKSLHDKDIFIRCEGFFPIHSLKQYSWYEMNEPDTLMDELFPQEIGTIALKNVTVKNKKGKNKFIKRKFSPVLAYDFNDFMNEFFDYHPNSIDYFKSPPNERVYKNWPYPLVRNYLSYRDDFLYFFDNVVDPNTGLVKYIPVNPQQMLYSDASFVDSLFLLTDAPKRPAYYVLDLAQITVYESDTGHGRNNRGGLTRTYLGFCFLNKFPEGKGRFVNGRYIKLHGFDRPAEFYSPDYSRRPLPDKADHRHTLYWNPELKTDAEGKAQAEFYNNAVCTELHISAEGLTKDGRMITY